MAAQFLAAAAIMLCLVMVVLGTWVSNQIKHSVLIASGVQAKLFMDAFLAPIAQGLEPGGTFGAEEITQLNDLLVGTPFDDTFVSVKIWRQDGLVLYSTDNARIGEFFDPTQVQQAAGGRIVAEFESVFRAEQAVERSEAQSLIEVYAPLYRTGTDEIIAVAETYENADALAVELRRSQQVTWLVVALTASGMVGLLFLIVQKATRTISAQRRQLQLRYAEARRLAQQNDQLRVAADETRLAASGQTEQFLSRIGSDLHDGPVQLLTLSTLRLTAAVRALKQAGSTGSAIETQIEGAVDMTQSALSELRTISAGLNLPEIASLNLEDTIRHAVARHEAFTGEKIELEVPKLPEDVSEALRICVFRVIQEGLNNATKHAPEAPKAVSVWRADGDLIIDVHDEGPGVQARGDDSHARSRMGLAGIRNRVAAFKGQVEIKSSSGAGTHLTVNLPLDQQTRSV